MAFRREKGLCYNCDEKWNSQHRCKSRILLLIADTQTHDPDPSLDYSEDPPPNPPKPDPNPPLTTSFPHISLNAISDVILGIVWIKLLGPVITDYTTLTIKFNHLDIPVQLNVDVTNGPTSALFQLTVTQTSAPDPDPLPAHPIPDIQYLLDTYSSIFTQPSTLPPPRAIEHHINL
ncbi:hypothetical protein GmHk_02G003827 [Glycine max]|nr:hypothetical protein GmHk_02G003827 [Glycine max]